MITKTEQFKEVAVIGTRILSDKLRGRKTIVNDERYKSRMKICRECEYFHNEKCMECGCLMSLKARIRIAKCPLDKWNEKENVQ